MMPPDHGLQQIIGAALVDEDVLAALLSSPLSLADRFGLTVRERRFIASVRARDLEHFAALVEDWRAGQPAVRNRLPEGLEEARLAG